MLLQFFCVDKCLKFVGFLRHITKYDKNDDSSNMYIYIWAINFAF